MSSRGAILWLVILMAVAPTTRAQEAERVVARYRQMLAANPAPGTALDRLWRIYQENGRTQELLADYALLAKGDFAAGLVHGFLLAKSGAMDAAREAFEKASKLSPDDPRAFAGLGEVFLGQDRAEAAAAAFRSSADRLPENDPGRPDLLLKLGNAWVAAHDSEKAAAAWEEIVAIRPEDLSLRRRLAQAYRANGLLKQAVPHLTALAEKGEPYDRVAAWRDLAQVHQSLGDADAAMQALDEGIALTAPGHWLREELQGELIRLHRRSGRVQELEKRWLDHAKRSPRDLGAYLQLIGLYRQTSELEKEREWLERLVKLAPQNRDARLRLAGLLVRLNDLRAAATVYDGLLADQPQDVDLVLVRAALDIQQGAVGRAVERVEALVAASGDEAVRARAIAFYRTHHLDDGVGRHLEALAAAPGAPPEAVLALADFHFVHGRRDDALRTLQGLVKADLPPAERAAISARIAASLREHGEPAAAIAALERAVSLSPAEPRYRLALVEALAGGGRRADAVAKAREVAETAAGPEAQLEADRALFQLLKTSGMGLSVPTDAVRGPALMSLPKVETAAAPDEGLAEQIERLSVDAMQSPTREKLMRAARWNFWNRTYGAAQQFVEKAIEQDPQAVDSRELAVKIFEGAGRRPEALIQLGKLAQIDVARAVDYRRQAARLEAEGGAVEASLAALEALAAEYPADPNVLGDHALALQQANRWYDALETWQKAYDAGGASDRSAMVQPLLRVLERLSLHDRALELLMKTLDAQEDAAARVSALRDLIAYATAHGEADWLRAELERRQEARPNDWFAQSALAQVLKAQHRDAEAFDLLERAAWTAPEPAAALAELVEEAVDLGRYEEAIEAQRRLIWLEPALEVEAFRKLAELQETWLDLEGATGTWEEIVSRFPRDPKALKDAAAFFDRWQEEKRAREVLRTVRVLEPGDLRALMDLADLALAAGEPSEALSAYEQIVQNTRPATGEDALRFPERETVEAGPLQRSYFQATRLRRALPDPRVMKAVRSFWSEGTREPRVDQDFRLAAIRGISTVRQSEGGLEGWLREWQRRKSSSPVEALWAFYYAGDGAATLAQLRELLERRPGDADVKQAFVWMALRTGEYAVLREWVVAPEREPADRDLFMVGLGQALASDRSAGGELAEELFPPSFHVRQVLWQAAALFANQGRFAAAGRLGERVFDGATVNRAEYGNEVGAWYLYAGDVESARRIFSRAAEGEGAGFDAALYEALRRYYACLPREQRAGFAEGLIAAAAASESPVHAAIVRTLLRGLGGEEEAAREALDDLLALRVIAWSDDFGETVAQRHWRFLLTAGVQLQMWKLNGLARYLWEAALADEAAIRLQGAEVGELVREVRLRLVSAQLLEDTPIEAEMRIANFARSSTPEMVAVLASMLENAQFHNQTVQALTWLCLQDPANPHYLRSLLNACRGADDVETARSMIERALREGMGDATGRREVVAQYLDFLIGQNDAAAALELIEASKGEEALDAALLERKARILAGQGRLDEAEEAYRALIARDDGNIGYRLSLAETLERAGKLDEAIAEVLAVKSRTPGTLADMRLAGLYLKKGDMGMMRAIARRLLRAHAAEVPVLASRLAAAGEKRLALVLLQGAIGHAADARLLVEWQLQALPLIDRRTQPALFEKSLARLKELAGNNEEFLLRYYDFRGATSTGEAEVLRELEQDWAGGSTAAGVKLAEHLAQEGDAVRLDTVLEGLLARGDASVTGLARLAEQLRRPKLFDLALRVTAHLVELQPMRDELWLEHARMLLAAGRRDEALERLERLSARRVMNEAVTAPLAEAYVEAGETGKARRLFEEAVEGDPTARNFAVYNAYARLLLRQRELETARPILVRAFRNLRNEDVSLLLAYVEAVGSLELPEPVLSAIQIPAVVRRRTLLALFRRFEPGEKAKAIALASRHPELVDGDPSLAERLRALAEETGRFEPVAGALEDYLGQTASPNPDVGRSLARVYEAMAARMGGDPAAGVPVLRRAHSLLPGDFDIASALCRRLAKEEDRTEAAAVWAKVIETTRDLEIKVKAREQLALLQKS